MTMLYRVGYAIVGAVLCSVIGVMSAALLCGFMVLCFLLLKLNPDIIVDCTKPISIIVSLASATLGCLAGFFGSYEDF